MFKYFKTFKTEIVYNENKKLKNAKINKKKTHINVKQKHLITLELSQLESVLGKEMEYLPQVKY